jgi:glycosyltransferase involved in cell wall biosynthesis
MASYAQRKHGVACIPFYHTNNNLDWSLYGPLRLVAPVYTLPLRIIESNCLGKIPVAFANSRDLAIQVGAYAKEAKFVVIPLGVDLTKFHPSDEDEEFILMAGRYDPTNNFELAIEALASTSYRLVIAGVQDSKHDGYAQQLRTMVKTSRELSRRVEFVTLQEDELIGYLQRCSIFLSPRKYGYLGLASLEAMACAKPVIAFDPGRGIERCPPILACGDNSKEWRTTISRLMEDKGDRTALGKQAFQFVEENHTWPKSVEKMLRVVSSFEARKSLHLS